MQGNNQHLDVLPSASLGLAMKPVRHTRMRSSESRSLHPRWMLLVDRPWKEGGCKAFDGEQGEVVEGVPSILAC
jgi:hypothetical protein